MDEFRSLLLALPPEVFVEICLRLNPHSLISVTRTCSVLRKRLLAGSAGHIWRAVRLNASPVAMERPQDLSEPAWTALIYDQRCHACGNIGLKVLWALHLRLCAPCAKLCRDKHVSLGGNVEAFKVLFHISGAYTVRANRNKFKESFILGVRRSREASATARQTPAAMSNTNSQRSAPASAPVDVLVADLHDNFLRCYFPPRVDAFGGIPAYLVPAPHDLLPALQSAVATQDPLAFWQLPYYIEGLKFAQMFSSWTRFVEHQMLQLLPHPRTADRESALSVWRAVDAPHEGPAWWPNAAHLYVSLSESAKGARAPVDEVLEYDSRAARVVYNLLALLKCPAETTARALDRLDAYVQCTLCSTPGTERDALVFHWRHAVSHALTQHPTKLDDADEPTWRRIPSQLVQLAATRDKTRLNAASIWRCGLCAWASRLSAPRRAIESHLLVVHNQSADPRKLDADGYIYAQPTPDSLHGLALPIALYDMVETFATSAVLSSSVDPVSSVCLVSDEPRSSPEVFFFCLKCPVLKRVRHMTCDASIREHLHNEHNTDDYILGETHTYLASQDLKTEGSPNAAALSNS